MDVAFALDLLAIADQFLVSALKRACEKAIKASITIENVSFMLLTADERQALALRRKCFDFMMRHFDEVIATEAFSSLPQTLLHEVLVSASQRKAQRQQQQQQQQQPLQPSPVPAAVPVAGAEGGAVLGAGIGTSDNALDV
jgi:hypothetical protein